jgi:hypothetical protein
MPSDIAARTPAARLAFAIAQPAPQTSAADPDPVGKAPFLRTQQRAFGTPPLARLLAFKAKRGKSSAVPDDFRVFRNRFDPRNPAAIPRGRL